MNNLNFIVVLISLMLGIVIGISIGYLLNNTGRYQIIKAERNAQDLYHEEALIILDTKTSKVFIYDDFYNKKSLQPVK